jgi:hypothetical protein
LFDEEDHLWLIDHGICFIERKIAHRNLGFCRRTATARPVFGFRTLMQNLGPGCNCQQPGSLLNREDRCAQLPGQALIAAAISDLTQTASYPCPV